MGTFHEKKLATGPQGSEGCSADKMLLEALGLLKIQALASGGGVEEGYFSNGKTLLELS